MLLTEPESQIKAKLTRVEFFFIVDIERLFRHQKLLLRLVQIYQPNPDKTQEHNQRQNRRCRPKLRSVAVLAPIREFYVLAVDVEAVEFAAPLHF